MSFSPIALFAYNRPDHLRRTLEALSRNELAGESELHVFSDAPRNQQAAAGVEAVRALLPHISGFKSVRIVQRAENCGLAESIIRGVSEVVNCYGRVIVLEDDMITSRYFLRYMNEALDLYSSVNEVIGINGYLFPGLGKLPETFFLRGADCWGWATWRRGWALFEPDGRKLLDELEARALCRDFDFDGTAHYTDMLRLQIEGRNSSWAVRWYASAFLAGKLSLYPGRSLVCNIGNDGSGQHCAATDIFEAPLASSPVPVGTARLEEHAGARAEFARYFRRSSGWRGRVGGLLGRIRKIMS